MSPAVSQLSPLLQDPALRWTSRLPRLSVGLAPRSFFVILTLTLDCSFVVSLDFGWSDLSYVCLLHSLQHNSVGPQCIVSGPTVFLSCGWRHCLLGRLPGRTHYCKLLSYPLWWTLGGGMLGPHSIFSSQRRLFLIRPSLNFDMLLDNMLLPNNLEFFLPFLMCLLIRILLSGRPVPSLLLSSTCLLRSPSTWCLFSMAPSFYEFFLPVWH